MQEIKFCQYCGGKNLDVLKDYNPAIMLSPKRYVQCNQCGSCGPLADDDNEAIQKWNSRIQEAPEMLLEIPTIITADKYDKFGCPIQGPDKPCNGRWCMMWVSVGNDKGRCGLVNAMYINSIGCGMV